MGPCTNLGVQGDAIQKKKLIEIMKSLNREYKKINRRSPPY